MLKLDLNPKNYDIILIVTYKTNSYKQNPPKKNKIPIRFQLLLFLPSAFQFLLLGIDLGVPLFFHAVIGKASTLPNATSGYSTRDNDGT